MDTPVALAAAEENKMIMLNASRRVFFFMNDNNIS